MKKIIYTMIMTVALLFGMSSCELDQYPHTSDTSNDVYSSVEGYQSVLGGIYAAMIQRISSVSDEERSQNYLRTLMMFQDCSTDACDAVWLAGESLTDVNGLSWNASDSWCSAMYYHIYNIVTMCNDLIKNATDEDLLSGFSDTELETIEQYRNEARFLRAYAYSHALDFYSKMPFVDENSPIGANIVPEMYDRAAMFAYITSELEEIAPLLKQSNYGHANSGAAYALLARLYLNGETYTGTAYYTECISACQSVIGEGYSLESDYAKLFNADNHSRTNEIIFALACDAANTSTWDATTFITCGEVLSNFDNYVEVWGTEGSGAWNNLRARPDLVDKFQDGDTRAMFISYDRIASGTDSEGNTTYTTTERSKDISAHDDATTGYRIYKWTNLTDSGAAASDCSTSGANTDFPVFRLADVYLMLAEAVVRGGSGASLSEALAYANLVRQRAFGSTDGNIGQDELTLDFLCDERLREMYMECIRRTDLIRFGKYTSGYNWQWKANVYEGADVDSKYRYLAIPEAEYSVNPQTQTANNELGF